MEIDRARELTGYGEADAAGGPENGGPSEGEAAAPPGLGEGAWADATPTAQLPVVQRRGRFSNARVTVSGLVACSLVLIAAVVWQAWEPAASKPTQSVAAAGTDPADSARQPVGDRTPGASGTPAPGANHPNPGVSPGPGSARGTSPGAGTVPAATGAAGVAAQGGSDTAPNAGTQAERPTPRKTTTARIIGLADKCVGAAGGRTVDGTAVDLYSCVGDGTQQWTFYSDRSVRTGGKCLDVSGGSTANGARVQLFECNGTPAQQWEYTAGRDLVNVNADKCLDVKDNASSDFAVTHLWTCLGISSQKWRLG